MKLTKWLKEPLLHFLLAGGALFALLQWLEPLDGTGLTITVGEDQLLEHLQSRAQLYDREGFAAILEKMSPKDRAQLVREAAQTEALWREGQALGLADADPLVRARVIQQMRQLVMEEAAADVVLSDEQVHQFYDSNKSRYAMGAQASFSHVFLSAERRGEGGRSEAEELLRDLNAGSVGAEDSGRFGDRFLYQRNYAQAGLPEIASQFGEKFAAALFALQPGASWQGPLQSQYGWHLVLLRERVPASIPSFAEIEPRVREDALAEERSRRAREALDRMMDRYEVVEE